MPIESIQHIYNLLGPQSWEKMQTYRNEKLSPSPLTDGLGRSPYGDRPRLDKSVSTGAFVSRIATFSLVLILSVA